LTALVALLIVPFAGLWGGLCLWLAGRQARRA